MILVAITIQHRQFILQTRVFFIKRIKRKGCRSHAIEMIVARGVTRKSVDAIYVFNARVIGAKQLIKSISRTIRCVRCARK